LTKTVLKQAVAEVARAGEDDGDGEPDLERVHVVGVELELPADHEVVHDREHERHRNTVCAST
jgi:hypothetical protein